MLLAVTIGAAIGLVLGLTGAGGSVLAVPLLMLGLGFSQPEAAGISLGAVGAAAWFGVLLRLRARQISWPPAVFLGLSGALLAPLGQQAARLLDETVLVISFFALVVVIAVRMWRQASSRPQETRIVRAMAGTGELSEAACQLSESGHFEMRWPCITRMLVVGAATGLLSGLYGVGGGFVIVPALVILTGLSINQAVGTSLVVIGFVSASGFSSFMFQNDVALSVLFVIGIAALTGMLAGTLLSKKIAGPLLQKIFVILMLVLSMVIVFQKIV